MKQRLFQQNAWNPFSGSHFFYAVLILNLLPLLFFRFFPSMDGPAHLYNARCVYELFKGNELLTKFYTFNQNIFTNWTDHLIMGFLSQFLPAWLSEKLFLLAYAIFLPVMFRKLVLIISPENAYISYLIFPFVYTFLFILGFYNLSLGVLLIILFFYLYYRYHDNLSLKRSIILFIVFTSLYVTHAFMYLICGLAIFLVLVFGFLIGYKDAGWSNKYVKKFLQHLLTLFIIALPSLIIFFIQMTARVSPEGGEHVFKKNWELMKWLIDSRTLIGYNYHIEKNYLFLLVFIYIWAFYEHLIFRIKTYQKPENGFWSVILSVFKGYDAWILASLFLFILYFILPYQFSGVAGFMSFRIAIPMYIFFFIWSIWGSYSKRFRYFLVFGSVISTILISGYYYTKVRGQNKYAREIVKISNHIEPNSVVLDLDYSDNWLGNHYSSYLGIDKPLVILKNYEAYSNSFPLKWDTTSFPALYLGNTKLQETGIGSVPEYTNGKMTIDYVFIAGTHNITENEYTEQYMQIIKSEYRKVVQSEKKPYELYHLEK
jgi:hypothetical protein